MRTLKKNRPRGSSRPLWKSILLVVLIIILAIVVLGIILVTWLSITEYRPNEREDIAVERAGETDSRERSLSGETSGGTDASGTYGQEALRAVRTGESLSIVTWNMGYGALGDNADFFMDGGKMVYTADETRVFENLSNIADELDTLDPDFIFLQEIDEDSDRSYQINEVQSMKQLLTDPALIQTLQEAAGANADTGSTADSGTDQATSEDTGSVEGTDPSGQSAQSDQPARPIENGSRSFDTTFAYNFKVDFVPYPIPPIGKVSSGILTMSRYDIASSTRVQLPIPFRWPVRTANLKRCLMVDRLPVMDVNGKDTGNELVLVNLHLEAYDNGEGKTAQTAMLRQILQEEADKGNYVIAGGDFNQTFSNVDSSMYPVYEGTWQCGQIDTLDFDDSWQFLMDNTTPTCRSLDQSYAGKDPAAFQFYMIDGFIVSSNIDVVNVETQDLQFRSSDHNPVRMEFVLQED